MFLKACSNMGQSLFRDGELYEAKGANITGINIVGQKPWIWMDVANVHKTKNPRTHQENTGLCISLNFFNILLVVIGGVEPPTSAL